MMKVSKNTDNRQKLFHILSGKLHTQRAILRTVVNSFSDFKVELLVRFLEIRTRQDRQNFQISLQEKLLDKKEHIEALQRRYVRISNTFKEETEKHANLFLRHDAFRS